MVQREKLGEKSGAKKKWCKKWDEKSGARKMGCEKSEVGKVGQRKSGA